MHKVYFCLAKTIFLEIMLIFVFIKLKTKHLNGVNLIFH
jgi:hypothetical protein